MSSHPTAGKYFLLGVALIIGVFLADQYSKFIVFETMLRETPGTQDFLNWLVTQKKIEFFVDAREHYKTVVLAPFLSFVAVWNQGISFGLFDSNAPAVALVLIGISLLAVLGLIFWLTLAAQKIVAIPVGMIAGGALANATDRIRFGAVADFIDVHAGPYHWPAFNLADSSIVTGAAVLIIHSLIQDRRTSHAKTAH